MPPAMAHLSTLTATLRILDIKAVARIVKTADIGMGEAFMLREVDTDDLLALMWVVSGNAKVCPLHLKCLVPPLSPPRFGVRFKWRIIRIYTALLMVAGGRFRCIISEVTVPTSPTRSRASQPLCYVVGPTSHVHTGSGAPLHPRRAVSVSTCPLAVSEWLRAVRAGVMSG
jgi:hypothetical protein